MSFRYMLTNAVLLGISLAVLVQLGLIAYYGSVLLQERIAAVLVLEVLIITGCLGLAIFNLIKPMRR